MVYKNLWSLTAVQSPCSAATIIFSLALSRHITNRTFNRSCVDPSQACWVMVKKKKSNNLMRLQPLLSLTKKFNSSNKQRKG